MTNFRDRISQLPDSNPASTDGPHASEESKDIVVSFTKLAAYIIATPEDKFDGSGTADKIEELCKRRINLPDPSEIINMAEAMIESKMPAQIASIFIGKFLYHLLKSYGRFDND